MDAGVGRFAVKAAAKRGFAGLVAAVALVLCAAAPRADASVFSRLFGRFGGGSSGRGGAGASSAERLVGAKGGAECVLRRPAQVNGAVGDISAWTLPGVPGEAALCFSGGAAGTAGDARWNLPDVPEPAGLVVAFDAAMSAASPDASGCEGASGVKICSGGAAGGQSPEVVRSALRAALAAGGWVETAPVGGTGGLSIWQRRGAVVLAWAGADSQGDALWLLLRRQ